MRHEQTKLRFMPWNLVSPEFKLVKINITITEQLVKKLYTEGSSEDPSLYNLQNLLPLPTFERQRRLGAYCVHRLWF
jgi:hypothetical protein